MDARTDVYSLAILVYEMIVGAIPDRWVTEDSTRAGRFIDAAATHRPYLSASGGVVEGALVRALALRPDQRTQTPAAFIEDLRGRSHAGKRKYRQDEIEAIVNRAAEIEASNPTMSGAMTIGGIEEVARDVGIAPRHVRSALAALNPRRQTREAALEQPKRNILIGGPTRLLFERIVEGELQDSDYSLLVEEIRIALKEVGQVSQLGRSFSWTLNKGSSSTQSIEVAVNVRNGRTRIIVQENLANLIGAIFGGVGGGLGGGGMGPLIGGLVGSKLVAASALGFLIPGWFVLVYGVARSSYYYAVKRRTQKLAGLADRLAELSRDLIGEPPKLPEQV